MPSAPITAAACDRVLVLQGGGALGSYQAGVAQGLAEADLRPGWVAGISIGAINAALIAGNPPEERYAKLRAFWDMASSAAPATHAPANEQVRAFWNEVSAGWIAAFGVPGFFTPRVPPAFLYPPGAPQAISLYDTAPLKETLERLVDFDRLNRPEEMRFSVGAVNVRSGNFVYFDNTKHTIRPEHIMASGALPPGFPPVEIDFEHYWDGGIVSNTPLQHVLDEAGERNLLIFQVDLFSARGDMPKTLLEAAEREKDIRFSSRTRLNTDVYKRLQDARAALQALIQRLPPDFDGPELDLLRAFSKESSIAIVQLIYRAKLYEGNSKDYEFSRVTMEEHWKAGLSDVRRTLRHREWLSIPMKPGVTTYDLTGDGRIDVNPP